MQISVIRVTKRSDEHVDKEEDGKEDKEGEVLEGMGQEKETVEVVGTTRISLRVFLEPSYYSRSGCVVHDLPELQQP